MPVTNFTAPNGDSAWADFSGLYSKGLLQDHFGVVTSSVSAAFVADINKGKAAVNPPARPIVTPTGPLFEEPALQLGGSNKLNGPQGAFAGQICGPDSSDPVYKTDMLYLPPKVGSPEYAVELAELYWASLLRDVPFGDFSNQNALVQAACKDLTSHVALYRGPTDNNKVTPALLFRGGFRPAGTPPAGPAKFFDDERFGPYLSQLCLSQTMLGAQPVNQKIETILPGRDYMTDLNSWYAVQNGGSTGAALEIDPIHRHIRNGRDLAAYTHVDELYQAYLTAYLVLQSWQTPPNPGIPYLKYKHQKAFGSMGGPDIAATLGLVARAAIDAVWWQKWAIHLRHRPEAGGGLVHLWKTGAPNPPQAIADFDAQFGPILSASLDASAEKYSRHSASAANKTFLLSQAFPEGSPTHPAFPTGHGTVAGACITVLKFFYDGDQRIGALTQPVAPSHDGLSLIPYKNADVANMTVNGELHKLAHNISFGHGIHAGIHWRSDTDQSLLLGEKVAIQCLQQQVAKYSEPCAVSFTLMDGTTKTIMNN